VRFAGGEAAARSAAKRAVLFEMLREFQNLDGSAESISTCSMRAFEVDGQKFSAFHSHPNLSSTCVLGSAAAHFSKPKAHFGFVPDSTLRKCKNLGAQKNIRITMQNQDDAGVLNSPRCADRMDKLHRHL